MFYSRQVKRICDQKNCQQISNIEKKEIRFLIMTTWKVALCSKYVESKCGNKEIDILL